MSVPLFWVDAFTERPFAGNPAAVCLLDAPCDDARLQSIAAEMNLSETAFLYPQADGYQLRWFTPTVEVPLCGHATLARVTGSAHCTLAPFWQARCRKNELLGYQASRRGGSVKVRVAGDRVYLG